MVDQELPDNRKGALPASFEVSGARCQLAERYHYGLDPGIISLEPLDSTDSFIVLEASSNSTYCCLFPPQNGGCTLRVLDEAEAFFRARKLPPKFIVNPGAGTCEASYLNELTARGYRWKTDSAVMRLTRPESPLPRWSKPDYRISISRISPEDTEQRAAFCQIFREAYRNGPNTPVGLESFIATRIMRHFSETRFEVQNCMLSFEGQPAGVISLSQADGWGYLGNVGALPTLQSRGFSSQLIEHASVEFFSRKENHTLLLSTTMVADGSDYVSFYRRRGFSIAYVNKRYG